MSLVQQATCSKTHKYATTVPEQPATWYWMMHLTVEGDTVAAVVVAVEGLGAEAAACIPDGDGFV